MLRDLSELAVGDPVVHEQHGIGRYRGLVSLDLGEGADRVPAARVRRRRQALRAGRAAAHDRALLGRPAGAGAAAQAGRRRLGQGQAQGGARRCATPPPSSSTSTPSAPRARAGPFEVKQHDLEAFAEGFGFEETADQSAAIEAVVRDMTQRQADGPPGLRRRRLRQDRSRAARRLRRGGRRPAGRGAHADHAARRAAFRDVHRPLRRLAGAHRRAVALPHRQGDRPRRSRDSPTAASTSPSAPTSCSRAT